MLFVDGTKKIFFLVKTGDAVIKKVAFVVEKSIITTMLIDFVPKQIGFANVAVFSLAKQVAWMAV